jgi:hypothetical protein
MKQLKCLWIHYVRVDRNQSDWHWFQVLSPPYRVEMKNSVCCIQHGPTIVACCLFVGATIAVWYSVPVFCSWLSRIPHYVTLIYMKTNESKYGTKMAENQHDIKHSNQLLTDNLYWAFKCPNFGYAANNSERKSEQGLLLKLKEYITETLEMGSHTCSDR